MNSEAKLLRSHLSEKFNAVIAPHDKNIIKDYLAIKYRETKRIR
jgi:hypothetical protein